jgi:hypothetical protein
VLCVLTPEKRRNIFLPQFRITTRFQIAFSVGKSHPQAIQLYLIDQFFIRFHKPQRFANNLTGIVIKTGCDLLLDDVFEFWWSVKYALL